MRRVESLMSSRIGNLRWLVDRFRVMPPAEIPHRLREQGRRRRDTQGAWSPPQVPPCPAEIPSLPLALQELSGPALDQLRADVDALLSGQFHKMGVAWPSRRAWGLDPGSGWQWPLSGPPSRVRLVQATADVRVGWELLRLQHLQVLALGAALLGRDDARDAVLADIDDYLTANPPYEGLAFTSGIECGLRVVSLLTISACVPLPPSVWDNLHHHAVWLRRYPSLYSSANNHRIAELSALYLLGLCAPGVDVGGVDAVEAELLQTARQQFHHDGVGTEQSFCYQGLTTELLALCRWTGLRHQRDVAGFAALLRRSAGFLSQVSDCSGGVPRIGDDDESMVISPTLSPGAYPTAIAGLVGCLLGDASLVPPGWALDLRTQLLGLSVPGPAPRRKSRCFAAGGYTVLRQDSVMAMVDHGPLGFWSTGGHGHADTLAVWLHAKGQPIIVDTGTHSYHGPQGWRTWIRSTAAHNTVMIDGLEHSEVAGPFNWSRRARGRLRMADLPGGRVEVEHDGYLKSLGLMHIRTVTLHAEGLDIHDRIDGQGEHEVTVKLQLAPGLTAASSLTDELIQIRRGSELIATAACSELEGTVLVGGLGPAPGVVSTGYNVAMPAPCLIWQGRPAVPADWTISWRWAPTFLRGET